MNNCDNRILLIVSEFPPGPGGIGSHAYSLTCALVKKGFCIDVLTNADYVSQSDVKQFDDTQLFSIIRFSRKGYFVYVRRWYLIAKQLCHCKYRTVFVSNTFALWSAILLRLLKPKLRIIAILHGSEVRPKGFKRWITHFSLLFSSQCVAVSHFTASLIPKWITRKKKVTIITNGIHCADYENLSFMPKDLQGSPCLLTVGNVTPRKGQHRVIKALPSLIIEYPNIHYHVVGLPTNVVQLESLSKQLGVDSYVTFHGKAPTKLDLAAYYAASDIFMLLSENQPNGDVEGFGIVVLEAGMFQLPTIGALFCGIDDAVCEGYNGLLVDGNDVSAVCRAVGRCLQDTEMRQRAEEWSRNHNWDTLVTNYIELFS